MCACVCVYAAIPGPRTVCPCVCACVCLWACVCVRVYACVMPSPTPSVCVCCVVVWVCVRGLAEHGQEAGREGREARRRAARRGDSGPASVRCGPRGGGAAVGADTRARARWMLAEDDCEAGLQVAAGRCPPQGARQGRGPPRAAAAVRVRAGGMRWGARGAARSAPDALPRRVSQEPWASPATKLATPSPAKRPQVPLIKDKLIQKKSAASNSIMPAGVTMSRGVCSCLRRNV